MAWDFSASSDMKTGSPTQRPSASKANQPIEVILVNLFRSHWRTVRKDLENGVDVAAKCADCFYAGRQRERQCMSRRYYSLKRAVKFSSSSPEEIMQYSEAWLDIFRDYAVFYSMDPDELRKELKQLVAAEYVAATRSPKFNHPLARPGQEVPGVSPLPNTSVLYGDIYEITAGGMSSGAYIRVCKSVAEPFKETERAQTMIGLRREFYANLLSDSKSKEEWQFNFRNFDDPRIIEADIIEVDIEDT